MKTNRIYFFYFAAVLFKQPLDATNGGVIEERELPPEKGPGLYPGRPIDTPAFKPGVDPNNARIENQKDKNPG